MRYAIAWAALSLPALLLLIGPAVAQKKDDKDKDLDKDKPKDVWIKAGVIGGKVAAVYEDKRKLRVSVPVLTVQGNQLRIANQDVEVQAVDDVVVRTARPKEDFDDKGKIKKYTKAELKELKGPDPKLPGYKAEFADIQTEQYVQLTVVRKKGAAKAKPKAVPKKKKGKDNDADLEGLLEDNTPQVSMILIVVQAPVGK